MTRHLGWHSVAVLIGLGAAALFLGAAAASASLVVKIVEYWNTERASQ